MAGYIVTMQRTASAALSLGAVNAAAASQRRLKIYDIVLGSEGAVADNPFLYVWQRCTDLGTRTSVTPKPLDPADAACVSVAGENFTVEPTYTASEEMLVVALNQRATFRWAAVPGREIVVPATANNGVGCQTPTSAAVLISATVMFDE